MKGLNKWSVAALAAALWLNGVSAMAASVDVNKASRAELESVKGLGPALSKRILAERDQHGAFKSAQDLSQRVSGLGEKKLKRLQKGGLVVPTLKVSEPARPKGLDAATPKQRVGTPSHRPAAAGGSGASR